MKKKSPTVLFFGSGPVAAKSLELLLKWQSVEFVVTKATPKHHKASAPVVEVAKANNIDIKYANSTDEINDIVLKTTFKSQCAILIDFGVIISQKVIEQFYYGIVNSHFSILPQWRGADPITFSILSGQKTTGVSIALLDSQLDTGDVLSYSNYAISPDCTTPKLTNDLIELSDTSLKQIMPLWLNNQVTPIPQNNIYIWPDNTIAKHLTPTYSRKLTKQDGLIEPDKLATQLEREVRAYLGWPGSRLEVNNTWLTVTKASISKTQTPKGVLTLKDGQLLYGCGGGSLNIEQIKPAGKKEMSATAFCNGYAHLLSK